MVKGYMFLLTQEIYLFEKKKVRIYIENSKCFA